VQDYSDLASQGPISDTLSSRFPAAQIDEFKVRFGSRNFLFDALSDPSIKASRGGYPCRASNHS